jgi:WhiB family transcriptional regulator, redox-sensing transcriptional regulator
VRRNMLLERTTQGGSGPWPPAPTVEVVDDRGRFDEMVAGLVPCRNNDPELWFAEHTARVEQAKALCRECPLMAGCLAGAIERGEPWGVWGGEVFVGGVVVATKRGRGRPRKDAALTA